MTTTSSGEAILRAALKMLEINKTGRNAAFMGRLYAPYCARLIGDRVVLPVNRYYKPLGLPRAVDFLRYEDFLAGHGIPLLDLPPTAREPIIAGDPAEANVYFYREGRDEPWAGAAARAAYLGRVRDFFDL